MQKKKGISLIVLIITIIVMIILAGSIILSLNSSGIIDKARQAVDVTNLKEIQQVAQLLWADAYADGARSESELTIEVVNGLAEIEGLNVNDYIVTGTTTGVTVEKANYEYYSTLAGAINDVNNNTIGTNADAIKAEAVAGIYVNNGKTYVVMFKDTTEETIIQTSVDMTLNLGGHTLATNDATAIYIESGHLTIDGTLSNSKIKSSNPNVAVELIKTNQEKVTNLTVNGGTYETSTDTKGSYGFCVSGTVKIYNAVINTNDTKYGTIGIQVLALADVTISNCKITSACESTNFSCARCIYC